MLPPQQLVALHVDRGPLDAATFGGSIALSGFAPPEGQETDKQPRGVRDCWTQVASALWREGATLAYAGRWRGLHDDLVALLAEVLGTLPAELRGGEDSAHVTAPRLLSFASEFDTAIPSLDEQRRIGLKVIPGKYLDEDERNWEYNWKVRAIERFRRRFAASQASVARFVVGGELPGPGDRPSGVVEEVIHSLAMHQPIYVAGGFGGVTQDLGVVLGLSSIRTGSVPDSLKDQLTPTRAGYLREIADRLQPPPFRTLPVFPEEQVKFLHRHALDGPRWPWNGLSADENRRLFECDSPGEVTELIVKGLRRVAITRGST